jgi:pyruvate/2-oxoglutarate dehydrogenase complex dihydrolipoamide acyltransferase (E2) component
MSASKTELRDQVENATLNELGGGIAGWNFELIENDDGTVTGRISGGYEIGGGTDVEFPYTATFQRSQFVDPATRTLGEGDTETEAIDYTAIDPIEQSGLSDREQAINTLRTTEAEFSGPRPERLDAVVDAILSDQTTSINVGGAGGRTTLNIPGEPSPVFASASERAEFVDAVETLGEDAAAIPTDALDDAPGVAAELRESRQRREARETARDAAEAAGVDLDEFGIGATDEGEVIVQDRDTGQTRTIDADTSGGLGAAIDTETSGGGFVADDADPAAGSTSGGGFGARAAGAIVLLFGALAAALGWLS